MAEVTSLWADCWYPWLSNGWIRCVCGDWFRSESGGLTASDKHQEHAREAHAASGVGRA